MQRVESEPQNEAGSTRLLSVEDQEQRIRNILLGQLSRAMKTRHQLSSVLLRRECDPSLFEPILDRYEEAGLINDREYARAFVASRIQSRGVSRSAARRELRNRGVSDELIEAALADVTSEDEIAKATELAEKKLRSMAALDTQVVTRRIFGFLQRRGYSSSIASDAIRRAKSQAVN